MEEIWNSRPEGLDRELTGPLGTQDCYPKQ